MVCNWSPEPPSNIEERMSMPTHIVAVESDDSDDETMGNAPAGYELLPQGPAIGLSSDEEEQSENEMDLVANSAPNLPAEDPSTSQGLSRRRSEVDEVSQLFSSGSVRTELPVDCDEVRAAMSGFTLPPSAYPPWARNIPETQLANTLAHHVQRIQSERSNT